MASLFSHDFWTSIVYFTSLFCVQKSVRTTDQLDQILNYLVSMLPGHAKIHSTEDVNTTNAFIPIVVYLALNGNHFPSANERKKAIHWLYAALLWSRYTAQTDQRLERDISIVV